MDQRPQVLVLQGCFLPGLDATGPNHSLVGMVRALHNQFDFRVVSDSAAGERGGTWTDLHGVPRFPVTPGRERFTEIAREVERMKPDLIMASGFFDRSLTIPFLALRRLGRIGQVPVLLCPHGEFAPGALQIGRTKKQLYLAAARSLGLLRGVKFQATNREEGQHIQAALGAIDVVLGPNVAQLPDPMPFQPRTDGAPLRVITIGRIDRMKNIDLTIRLLDKAKGAIELMIVGPVTDPRYWDECRALIQAARPDLRIVPVGEKSHHEVQQLLARADLFMLPSRGENYGYAIVDALAAGVPALISDRTNWRGLEDAGAGWDLPLDGEGRFVAAVEAAMTWTAVDLLRRRARARAYIEQRIAGSDAARMLADCLTMAMRGPAPA